jgi:hypothetical protein
MKIAILAWDSFESDPDSLCWLRCGHLFKRVGPALPVEFSRISKDGRLTPIIDKNNGTEVTTRVASSTRSHLHEAVTDLWTREMRFHGERCDAENSSRDGSVGYTDITGENASVKLPADTIRMDHQFAHERIMPWLTTSGFDAVIWTALPSNYKESTGREFSVEEAVHYLTNLPRTSHSEKASHQDALEYIARAPEEVQTRLRIRLRELNLIRRIPSTDNNDENYSEPPTYLAETLNDAEWLLKYAAEAGTDIDHGIRNHILQARAASAEGWNKEAAANLLAALTKLAKKVKPVRKYFYVAICLAVLIVPFSVFGFVASNISSAIRTNIDTANDLVVKLRVQLVNLPSATSEVVSAMQDGGTSPNNTNTPIPGTSPPSTPTSSPTPQGLNDTDVIRELQQLASTIREIDARALLLNYLILPRVVDPFKYIRENQVKIHRVFQLPEALPDLPLAASERTLVYQEVRYFAQKVLDAVSFFYGAFTNVILPVLYALLGTCAYLSRPFELRSFERQWSNWTFQPSFESDLARFLIAGIGGGIVGLFNNFGFTQGTSMPPLAVAFLVGYAVDVFFSFLEGLLQTFKKNTPTSGPSPPAGRKGS